MSVKWNSGRAVSIPKGLAMGNGVSLGMTLLMSFALAGLISRERLAWNQVGYGILAILFISALLGTAVSVKAVKRQWLMIALGSGLLFWATLIAITALFFGGQYDGMLVTGLIILAACGTVALAGLSGERGKGTTPYRRKGR